MQPLCSRDAIAVLWTFLSCFLTDKFWKPKKSSNHLKYQIHHVDATNMLFDKLRGFFSSCQHTTNYEVAALPLRPLVQKMCTTVTFPATLAPQNKIPLSSSNASNIMIGKFMQSTKLNNQNLNLTTQGVFGGLCGSCGKNGLWGEEYILQKNSEWRQNIKSYFRSW